MDAMVETVRAFNRTVTQRVGALDDNFLARNRPLGECRVLWEIGDGNGDGCEVRELRSRLGLDSGYLSRLLRSLEAAGLITIASGEHDKRVRSIRLTPKGRVERATLDDLSDEVARSMLGPLSSSQRERLVAAMGEVDRLLTASLVEIAEVDPTRPVAQHCLREYFAELDRRFSRGFDPASSRLADPGELRPPTGVFLVSTLRGEPMGCGGLRFHADAPTELKRMWVAPAARGLGLGRRLVAELEDRARDHGSDVLRLDTNKGLVEAIGLYRSAGYREVPAFNDEIYADHWFEKRLH